MDKKDVFKKVTAALFFFLGIYLTIMVVLTIGKDKGLAESKFQVKAIFNNVGGLMEGAPVRLSGVNIGSVADIGFLEEDHKERRVVVTINIFERFRDQLKRNAKFSIRTEGVLGEKLIEIYPLNGEEQIDLNQPVVGEEPLDIQNMASAFAGAAESFTNTSNELGDINMAELAQVMTESSKALLVTSEGINSIMDQLEEITLKSKRLFDRLEQKVIDGDLFKVF